MGRCLTPVERVVAAWPEGKEVVVVCRDGSVWRYAHRPEPEGDGWVNTVPPIPMLEVG